MKLITLVLTAVTVALVLPLRSQTLQDENCEVSCNGTGGGPCAGVGGDLEISCGSQRCDVRLEIGGNGGAVGVTQDEVSSSGDNPVTACTDDPDCCMDAKPCAGKTWGDVANGCENLCTNCYV
jgi:hypothetical protein